MRFNETHLSANHAYRLRVLLHQCALSLFLPTFFGTLSNALFAYAAIFASLSFAAILFVRHRDVKIQVNKCLDAFVVGI